MAKDPLPADKLKLYTGPVASEMVREAELPELSVAVTVTLEGGLLPMLKATVALPLSSVLTLAGETWLPPSLSDTLMPAPEMGVGGEVLPSTSSRCSVVPPPAGRVVWSALMLNWCPPATLKEQEL